MTYASRGSRSTGAEPVAFRLASLNAHCGRDALGAFYSMPSVLEALAAEVILVQENWRPRGGDSAALQAAVTCGYPHITELDVLADTSLYDLGVVTDRRADEPGAWGLAVLSRIPLVVQEPVWLGVAPRDMGQRAAQVIDLVVDERVTARLVNVHLTHRLIHGPRQLRRLVRVLRDDGLPTVIAGDLNMCRPTVYLARPYRPLVRGRTWPTKRPVAQLDHVLGGTEVCAKDSTVVPVRGSDHLPVRVTIEVGSRPAGGHHGSRSIWGGTTISNNGSFG
ncbi:endonuclease/exonuclease/phosphatase family protein [Micromonospora sp. WMMD1082]|uniref:endonuclease/exonuclease/phosphatase family protein n=1 Tax=Micromonospora sp. WMMD1082 TaxID=3016104 RepID=UPI0024168223|nr:endonuclease/exonuclease/phosphatase family protein [Micromonospora sp. WMMD1082]MDG4793681.1 endonuclease/exonuclease/phosphatase family protein [Micromonospora sp. WMMD1082]